MQLNCELNRRITLCLNVPGLQRQVFKLVKVLSERSKEMREQKKYKGNVLDANLLTIHKILDFISRQIVAKLIGGDF